MRSCFDYDNGENIVSTVVEQDFGEEPLEVRDTEHYQKEYVQRFVEK